MNRQDESERGRDGLAQSARSLRASRASASGWDGLLTTADLGVSQTNQFRSSKVNQDTLFQQIKHNFNQETHSFRSRILEATDEATRARERIEDVHQELLRLRKKYFKLQKIVQERDATIACMQEQQDLQLPMLMHETMRKLHIAAEDNQDEVEAARTMRSSVLRNRNDRSIIQEQLDGRVHEYEKQISRLYEELHQEKQKNEMLQDVLKEQKKTKAKLVKACKFARQEIESLKESDLTNLLEDLEIKCRELEHRNAALQNDLEFEKIQAANARQERDDLEDQLASRRQDASDWAARLDAKQREIERLRAQIHEQQASLENFQQDYDLVVDRTTNRSDSSMHTELQQECDLLIRALHRERARVADLEQQIQDAHQEQPRSRTPSQPIPETPRDDMILQIRSVYDKINQLHRQLIEYTDSQGLASSRVSEYQRSRRASSSTRLDASGRSGVDVVLSQCQRELDAMQRLMEETFARALGNNCAMQ